MPSLCNMWIQGNIHFQQFTVWFFKRGKLNYFSPGGIHFIYFPYEKKSKRFNMTAAASAGVLIASCAVESISRKLTFNSKQVQAMADLPEISGLKDGT